ncbi:histidine phosphatase superfamily [Flagelloscypha sp. PMI_526]|nr:histidine phosphatase superfamily [Flagelloscypha sp. PMI_526]
MVSATSKRIYFTRHAQGEHNVAEDWMIPDAPLTQIGRSQSQRLHESTKETFQQTAHLLVTSGLSRTMSTTLVGYPDLKKRLEAEGKNVLVIPQLQECNGYPCDIGSDREILELNPEFAGLDLSQLTPGWNSKEGFYAWDSKSLKNRARWVRKWLRDREETEIVVVSHGDCLRYITEGQNSWTHWANAQVRLYTFVSDDDEQAELVKVRDVYPGEDFFIDEPEVSE